MHKRQLALRLANTTFAQRDWTVEQPFLDAIAPDFGAGVNLVDYASDPAAARETINAWVNRHTEQRIPELLNPEDVSELTRFYLVNAIYLQGGLGPMFLDGETTPKTFHPPSTARPIECPDDDRLPWRAGPTRPTSRATAGRRSRPGYRGPTDAVPLAMTLMMPDDLRPPSSATERLAGRQDRWRRSQQERDEVRAGWIT